MIFNTNNLPPASKPKFQNWSLGTEEYLHPKIVVAKYKPHPFFLYNPQSIDHISVNSGDEYAYEYVKDERTYFVDTSFQRGMLVLPANPSNGFKILITDKCASWDKFHLIVHRNGKRIMGYDEHLTCDEVGQLFSLKYTETNLGWVVGNDFTTRELVTRAKEEGVYK